MHARDASWLISDTGLRRRRSTSSSASQSKSAPLVPQMGTLRSASTTIASGSVRAARICDRNASTFPCARPLISG